jgi:hypothetical protein
MNSQTLPEALAFIADEHGKAVLRDGQRLVAFLSDLVPQLTKERNTLKSAFALGLLQKLADARSKAPGEQKAAMNQCVSRLCSDYGLSRELAEDVLWPYAEALGFEGRANQEPPALPIGEIGDAVSGSESSVKQSGTVTEQTTTSETVSQKNAVLKAKRYLDNGFSRKGLIEQLEYEGFTNSEASYGADNVKADWMEQAVRKAKSFLNSSSFSRKGLIRQLESNGFTNNEATHGADGVGL